MNRRGFILGAITLPLTAKLPVGELVAAAPRALTYGDISARTAAWAARDMMRLAAPLLTFAKAGEAKPMTYTGGTVRFRRPPPFV